MKQAPAKRETVVLAVIASCLLIVFAGLPTHPSTKSADAAVEKPYTIEVYEGSDGDRGVLRARFRVRRNEAGDVVAHGLQKWLRSDGTTYRQQDIRDARLVGRDFERPGLFGKPQYFWRKSFTQLPNGDQIVHHWFGDNDDFLRHAWNVKDIARDDPTIEEFESELTIVVANGVVLRPVKTVWRFKEVRD